MFIIAGYEDDIENCLLAYNKGMKRRFQNHFKIDGYNADELSKIFLQKIKKYKYVTDISNEKLIDFFKENIKSFSYYGGDVEKLINEIKYVQCLRIFNSNIDNHNINYKDLTIAFDNIKLKKDDDYHSLYM